MPWKPDDLRRPIIKCDRIDLKLYRRNNGVGGPCSDAPHLEYILLIEWEPVDVPLPKKSWSPWWHALPSGYSIKRKWSDIERFHEAFEHTLYRDPKTGMARGKAKLPEVPRADDVDRWLTLTAATGDAKALRRQWIIDDQGQYNLLDDLHERRVLVLNEYFEQISAVLSEMPLPLLGGSSKLRSFVFGGRPREASFTRRPALQNYFYVGWPQPACFDPETRSRLMQDAPALRALGAKATLQQLLSSPKKKDVEPFRRAVSPWNGRRAFDDVPRLKSPGSLPLLGQKRPSSVA